MQNEDINKNNILYKTKLVKQETSKQGVIVSIQDGVCIITGHGTINSYIGEIFYINEDSPTLQGFVMNIEYNFIKIIIMKGDIKKIKANNFVYRTGRNIKTIAGFNILGQIVTPLGDCLNENNLTHVFKTQLTLHSSILIDIITSSPTIIQRSPVKLPFMTGISTIDCFLPIGCGQRELIIGDNNTGKTSLSVTILLYQKFFLNKRISLWYRYDRLLKNDKCHSGLIPCIFVSIGRKRSEVVRIKKVLLEKNCMFYTCLVFSSSDELVAIQYLAPFSGTAIGEWFRNNAYHALIIYDDLSQHAVSYRQISLLLRRPPGREAYPGDIFFLHAQLLERSAQLLKKYGGGSLTSLPIIETKGGDISSFIPTNVISITDGQIFLSITLANKGIRPSIDIGFSVSRVGSNAQIDSMKEISKKIKKDYSLFKAYESISKIGGEIEPTLLGFVNRGLKLIHILKQRLYKVVNYVNQILFLISSYEGCIDDIDINMLDIYFGMLSSNACIGTYNKQHSLLFKQIEYLRSILIAIPINFYIDIIININISFNKYFKNNVLFIYFQDPENVFWKYFNNIYILN